MDNYYEQRLEEIGQMLFKDGAFFSAMTEEEKDLFREAISLLTRKTVEEIGYQNGGGGHNDGHSHDGHKGENDQFSQIVDALRGFDINVNITPSMNYDHVHGHGGGNCECNNPESYPGHEYPEEKEYYTNAPINDGAYNPGPNDEMMYGEDMPLDKPKEEPKP